MRKAGLIIAVAGVAGLFGASGAFAQSAPSAPPPPAAPPSAQPAAPAAGKTRAPFAANPRAAARDAYTLDQSQDRQLIQLDLSKRFGLSLNIQPPVTRDLKLKDVEAGAAYRFNKSFSLGGAVGLSDKNAPEAKVQEKARERVAPKVKLNARYKF